MLKNKSNLKVLGLSHNSIGHGGARELSNVAHAALQGLTKISLESNQIGNMGLIALSKGLVENESLQEVYLYNNEIDDESMEVFSNMLRNKRGLRILSLEYNKIRNGAAKLCDAIQELPIERLMLSMNVLQPLCGEPIKDFLMR